MQEIVPRNRIARACVPRGRATLRLLPGSHMATRDISTCVDFLNYTERTCVCPSRHRSYVRRRYESRAGRRGMFAAVMYSSRVARIRADEIKKGRIRRRAVTEGGTCASAVRSAVTLFAFDPRPTAAGFVYLVCESVMCPVVLWQTQIVAIKEILENTNRITYCPLGPPVQGNIYLLFSGNHYDSIVTLQTQDRYDSQNTQKSPQSSNRPSQIASLPTTYRTAPAIYEDWGLDSKLLLLGDFNAHIGRDDNRGTKTRSRLQSISPTSNHLGSFLLDFCEQHNLVISSTWGRRSCKRTLEVQQNKSKTSRLALAKFMKAKFWKNRSPKDPATIQNFKDARKELLDLQEKEDEEKCQHFFAQMHKNGWKQFKFNPQEARPQSVNDYRKISICNAGYRIYATYLLKLLDEEIETMGNYQAAFMSQQNHVLSQRTYVNPMVWTKNPKYHQRKRGQTRMSTLTSAFTIVLDDVLRTLEELVSEVRLDQDAEINLPVILSFADDIIIIGDSTTVLTNIMKNLKELLISVGLKLNETKTKMLVRDPINKSIAKQTQEINGVLITPVDTIKYLGTYLTSELSRRDTIKARCKQAIRNAKGLIPFIKKTKCTGKSPS
ncbi:hypothetical protein EVAR_79491_1 [Eumeta japonica]|uniref:Reverse transcriptase domain-containing protein n=1 Tax=Eumeta variegata TaxID=151549 RepID=A0A4C1UF30_EUMVA|nr:hypothetical protein EVAR_79491_1 [Eumeta japonica]